MNGVIDMATNLVFSVQKALTILDLLVFEDIDKSGMRLSEISKKTGIKPNTLHNLLRTMISQNYIQQNENGNYATGIKLEKISILGQMNNEQNKYGTLQILESLRDDIQENVIFAVLNAGKWTNVKEFNYESAIQINNSKIESSGLYEKATGRILVSYCSMHELDKVLNVQGIPGEKWDGIETLNVLLDARQYVMKKGYVDMYTQNDQLWAIGIPVLNHEGNLIGSIGCAAPAFRCDETKKNYIRKRFVETAAQIKNYMI